MLFVLIFMLLVVNERELMGQHVNARAFNLIAWITVVVMIALTVAMLITARQRDASTIVSGFPNATSCPSSTSWSS